jgi:uncharacterized protein YndB with AHSA1/START domain
MTTTPRREDGPIVKTRDIDAKPMTVRRASVRIDHLRRWFAADATIQQGRAFQVSWPGWPVHGHFEVWEDDHVVLVWRDPVDASRVTIAFEAVPDEPRRTTLRFRHEDLEGHPTLRERYVTWWDHYLDNLKAYCEAHERGQVVQLDVQAGFKAIGVAL